MNTLKILILDDNPLVSRSIGNLVRELGHTTIDTATISSALDRLADSHVDVLLCDDDLGAGPSGFDLIRSIKGERPRTIILMSGNPKPDELPEGVLFLSKPFSIPQLEEVLVP